MQQSLFTPRPFAVEQKDFERWSKQKKRLFTLLSDRRLHRREELVEATNAQNITAVISDLRHLGAVIECTRSRGQIYYQLLEMTDESTVVKGIHCDTCRCSRGEA
tara:strand:- start:415 stop:729 length:315 start_codon:yes stop_codon:yes gene_type:complete